MEEVEAAYKEKENLECFGNEMFSLSDLTVEYLWCVNGKYERHHCGGDTLYFNTGTSTCARRVQGCVNCYKHCTGNMQLPHPKTDKLFIVCSNGIPTAMECPTGTTFRIIEERGNDVWKCV